MVARRRCKHALPLWRLLDRRKSVRRLSLNNEHTSEPKIHKIGGFRILSRDICPLVLEGLGGGIRPQFHAHAHAHAHASCSHWDRRSRNPFQRRCHECIKLLAVHSGINFSHILHAAPSEARRAKGPIRC